MTAKLSKPHTISTDSDLNDLVRILQTEDLLAVDTESNNLYAYTGQTCLIQVSSRTQDYIIDPLAINDMQPLATLLADASIEKIFHAAEYDLISLQRDFGFEVCNLFDTMYAARLCNFKHFGLADLIYNLFEVELDKSHQTDDWGLRPLPEDSLQYAQMDTHYLPRLRDILLKKLRKLGRFEEAQEVFADVLRIEAKDSRFDPEGYWKLGRPKSLRRRQMALLKEVYLLREEIAQEEDLPPFKVFTNKALIELVEEYPRNHTDLYRLRHVKERQVRVYGEDILEALQRGRKGRVGKPPREQMPERKLLERYNALYAWRKKRANKRGIGASLIVSKATLWAIAEAQPRDTKALAKIEGIGPWRLQQYGESLLAVVASMR